MMPDQTNYKSAINGQYVSESDAVKNEDTTYKETINQPMKYLCSGCGGNNQFYADLIDSGVVFTCPCGADTTFLVLNDSDYKLASDAIDLKNGLFEVHDIVTAHVFVKSVERELATNGEDVNFDPLVAMQRVLERWKGE